MKQYKVFYESREIQYAIIEADSPEEAEELADTNSNEYDWKFCDGTLTGEILIGETEEVNE